MTDRDLSYILRNIDLNDCENLGNNIYYTRKIVTLRVYDDQTRRERPFRSEEEFLVIAENGIKQGIILNCDNRDLHWYVFIPWRNKGVLSKALRTGIIKRIWPNIRTVTCCYNWDDDKQAKWKMTEHLAALAGLGISEDSTCWISTNDSLNNSHW